MNFPFIVNNVERIKWSGTSFAISGAILMAMYGHTHIDSQVYFYILYGFGSLFWFTCSSILKDKPMMVQQGVFFIVDMIGLMERLTI